MISISRRVKHCVRLRWHVTILIVIIWFRFKQSAWKMPRSSTSISSAYVENATKKSLQRELKTSEIFARSAMSEKPFRKWNFQYKFHRTLTSQRKCPRVISQNWHWYHPAHRVENSVKKQATFNLVDIFEKRRISRIIYYNLKRIKWWEME